MPKRATSRRGEGSSLSNDNSESESEPESQRETDSEEEMKKMATMYKYVSTTEEELLQAESSTRV